MLLLFLKTTMKSSRKKLTSKILYFYHKIVNLFCQSVPLDFVYEISKQGLVFVEKAK